jgi:hypothetical protein
MPASPHRWRRGPCWAAVLAGCALLAAGCSSGPSHASVAHLGTTKPTTSSGGPTVAPAVTTDGGQAKSADGLAYARCMRKNGVAAFPDPGPQGGFLVRGGPGSVIDPGSPQFQHAQQICQKLLPNGGQPNPAAEARALAQALKFSQCMRAHGIKSFPDPQDQGGGRIAIGFGPGTGINPASSQFQAAQTACQTLLPGKGGGLRTSSGGGRTAANG